MHIHYFSEASLATLLLKNGFEVGDAWFFGQDAVESAFQLSEQFSDGIRKPLDSDFFNSIQQPIDRNHLADLMMFAARRTS
jgi:hypothetical protein